jgi:hypothetical protein
MMAQPAVSSDSGDILWQARSTSRKGTKATVNTKSAIRSRLQRAIGAYSGSSSVPKPVRLWWSECEPTYIRLGTVIGIPTRTFQTVSNHGSSPERMCAISWMNNADRSSAKTAPTVATTWSTDPGGVSTAQAKSPQPSDADASMSAQ